MRSDHYHPAHFLDTYMLAAGINKAPDELHLWCGISLLAAAMQNRVWLQKVMGAPLLPNLYTLLIAPSGGGGKGTAIRTAQHIAGSCDIETQDLIAELHGKTTFQAMISHMAKRGNVNFIWLIMPELAMSVGSGAKADDLIKHLTGFYEGLGHVSDWTRQYGEKIIEGTVCINWLAASTIEWVVDSISPAAIKSGFFGRCCPIPTPRKHIVPTRPLYSPDQTALVNYLAAYITSLTADSGEMIYTRAGLEAFDAWFRRRAQPVVEVLYPFWDRQDDLVEKLAMILARGDEFRWAIDERHVIDAVALTDWIYERLPALLVHATTSDLGRWVNVLLGWFGKRSNCWIPRADIARAMAGRDIHKPQLDMALAALVDRGAVECSTRKVGERGAQFWCWKELP